MERNLIILAVGIAIGYFIFKQGIVKTDSGIEVIKPGDKSKDIEGMQKAFEKIGKIQFKDYGVYDEETLEAVKYLLKGTSGLIDNKGSINKQLVFDIAKIELNSQTI